MKVIGSSDFDLFLLSLSMFFFEVIYVNHNVIARRMKNFPRLAESSLRRGNLKIKKQMGPGTFVSTLPLRTSLRGA
jgi:hypothetical protein